MQRRVWGAGAWVGLLALILAGCAPTGGSDGGTPDGAGTATDQALVVATTAILGDITQSVVDNAGRVVTLMGPGADPHSFEPSAAQVRQLRSAELVVANGLQLEEAMGDVLAAAEDEGTAVLRVAERLDPLPLAGDDEQAGADPHVWLDPARMVEATDVIAERFSQLVPTAADVVEQAADAYRKQLRALDASIRERLSCIPEQRRRLVTNHAALGYFAQAYDFEVVGTVISGGSTLGEPSAQQLATLARLIERTGVRAIFTDTSTAGRLATTLQSEVAQEVEVVELYTGSLGGPGSGAETYIDMMATNAQRIADGLGC